MLSIGDKLKKYREEQGLYKTDMARLLEANYHTYCKWEDDFNIPGANKLFNTAVTLGWSLDEIEPWLDLPEKPDVLRQILIRSLEKGLTRTQVAHLADVNPSNFLAWCREDKPVTEPGLAKLEALADSPEWDLDYEWITYEDLVGPRKTRSREVVGPAIPRRGVGGVINYTLIQQLEAEYGQLTYVPDDEPRLQTIREELRPGLCG